MSAPEDVTRPIVVHVPKTGGTTLIMAIGRGQMPPRVDEHYRHVHWNQSRTITHSNCGDIFGPRGAELHAGRRILLTLRRPIDRLESEYHFLGNRKEYRRLWNDKNGSSYPDSFRTFIESAGATESMTRFLLGRDLFDPAPVDPEEGARMIERLDQLDFVFGLTHEMADTIRNAEHHLGIECEPEIRRHRSTVHKPDRPADWPQLVRVFHERNPLDLELYAAVVARFESQVAALPADEAVKDRSFVGDRYDSLMGFVSPPASRSPFEVFVKDLPDAEAYYGWAAEHRPTLVHLNVMARKADARDGRRFLVDWLERTMRRFPPPGDDIAIDLEDPLRTARIFTLRLFG